ncbi:hypothetical protein SAMN05216344_102174 [Polaromonas sp. OV174]|uniref:hypothetical protein n=1 Tax=Polaromonas sp. OV174 TaxID=1855300 RepID=UPI0008E5AA53|nr:hypothetical protein [Polaromonas sp. OV174]SFB74226.1 hypothetical protein SAMN05216344_102174 [Polaromonas sp. OV174]
MSDLKSNIAVALALSPAVHAATKADSPIVDLQGAGSATVVINTGAIAGAGDYTISLRHGDAADLTGDAAATGADLIGTFPATLAADTSYAVGYRGNKRYVRAVITKNSGTSIAAGATIVKGSLALRGAV